MKAGGDRAELGGHVLIRLAVRGHRVPPDPRESAVPPWETNPPPKESSRSNRRFLTRTLESLVGAVVRNRCADRGGQVVHLVVGRTFVHALVRFPSAVSLQGLVQSIKQIANTRARKAGWPRAERVFAAQDRVDALPTKKEIEDVLEALRRVRVGSGAGG